jgi:hypothetical protein
VQLTRRTSDELHCGLLMVSSLVSATGLFRCLSCRSTQTLVYWQKLLLNKGYATTNQRGLNLCRINQVSTGANNAKVTTHFSG